MIEAFLFLSLVHFRPVFRSYKPNDEGMHEGVLPEAEPAEVTDKVREELDREHEAIQIDKLVSLSPKLN